jgi:hypothetical protein
MFSLFTSKTPTPVKPVLAPLPPRKPCSSICNEQEQSPFFRRLPAEVRNDIYYYAFDAEPRELLSVEAHPLSMLLTCHKVNHEATNLAFSRLTFPLSTQITPTVFGSMRHATLHLSTDQVDAITAVSYDQRGALAGHRQRSGHISEMPDILTNAILLFPSLRRFEIRNLRIRNVLRTPHQDAYLGPNVNRGPHADLAVIEKYAPYWFVKVLEGTIHGHAYAWQSRERWTIDWPQLKDSHYLSISHHENCHGGVFYKISTSTEAVGAVRGVHLCPCSCNGVEWTSADLVQETGRIITVEFVYYGPEERPLPKLDEIMSLKARLGPRVVFLKEGTAPLDVTEGPGSLSVRGPTSFEYAADEEYWKEIRWRNGKLGAGWRDWWWAVTQGPVARSLPGSKALGEGDWAWVEEMSEAREAKATTNDTDSAQGDATTRT